MNLIEQNLAAQDNILTALTDAYAQTANVRKSVEEIVKRREMTISSLIASYDAYEDLLAKSSKGLEFYRKLEINVTKLLQRVKSTCKVQEEEREQILAQDGKNTYEKTDSTILSTYDQGHTRSTNNLKLKDYLNSRVENATGYQNPYYNLYKGHTATMRTDSVSRSLTTDVEDKNFIQSSSAIPASGITSSSVKVSQQYYPTTYTDYRTTYPYSYGTQTYYENPIINNTLNSNYLPTTNTNTGRTPQQPALSPSTTVMSNSTVQYPASSYLPNRQALPTSTTGQEKFHNISHSNYSVSDTNLQYEAYQSPAGYNNYNVTTTYVPNQEKTTAKTGIVEPTHVQTPLQMPVSTIGAIVGSTVSIDGQEQASYNIVQQNQQYDNQQKKGLNQELSHAGQNIVTPQHTLSTKDNTLTQNYALPQTGHPEMAYPQNYEHTYYNPTELQTQQMPFTHNTYDTTVVTPTQYIQSQQPGTSNQIIQSATSTNEISTSYPSNLHNVNPIEYSQQNNVEQDKQSYTDKTYGSYGTQVQMNSGTSNYSHTYQNYEHNTAGALHQQPGMLTAENSNTYAYLNCSNNSEIIQSHTKAATAQNYSQPYQYPHQGPYSGYVQYPNYSQNQNYTYMQNIHGTNSMAYTYNPASQTQDYAYASSNPQTTQISQTLKTTVAIPSCNVNISQQQETNVRYTNASSNAMVSQTPSSQYSQIYQSQTGDNTYYTTPYGLQIQSQGTLYFLNKIIIYLFLCVIYSVFQLDHLQNPKHIPITIRHTCKLSIMEQVQQQARIQSNLQSNLMS